MSKRWCDCADVSEPGAAFGTLLSYPYRGAGGRRAGEESQRGGLGRGTAGNRRGADALIVLGCGWQRRVGHMPLPDDIEGVCSEQVARWYQSRANAGVVSFGPVGGAATRVADVDLLPSVRAVLKGYQRVVWS